VRRHGHAVVARHDRHRDPAVVAHLKAANVVSAFESLKRWQLLLGSML
jgi:hypothetical protein